jgi:hypothetical protein
MKYFVHLESSFFTLLIASLKLVEPTYLKAKSGADVIKLYFVPITILEFERWNRCLLLPSLTFAGMFKAWPSGAHYSA